jgi:hypothetical protein
VTTEPNMTRTAKVSMTDGLAYGVDAGEYHQKALGVVSKSALDRIHKSPAHYRAWLEGGERDTPAMSFGRAFHCYVLEPEVFAATYAVVPDLEQGQQGSKDPLVRGERRKGLHRPRHAGRCAWNGSRRPSAPGSASDPDGWRG